MAIRELCDDYVERFAVLDPTAATLRGVVGHEDAPTDYSPEGLDARAELDRTFLRAARDTPIGSSHDERVARAVFVERLEAQVAVAESEDQWRSLRGFGRMGAIQSIRQVFDVMPRGTDEHWEQIATRMAAVPAALAGARATLEEAVRRDLAPARRQVLVQARFASAWAGADGNDSFFDGLVSAYGGDDAGLRQRLVEAATAAAAAYDATGRWLTEELAPRASPTDAVGAERYAMAARATLGADIDPGEIYRWGWEELHRLEDEMVKVADTIKPGASVPEVIDLLESDPARAIHGEDNLRQFLQDLMDRTIEELDGRHFDIPEPLRQVEAMIAPPGGAAAMYYSPPSEDFSRPGRTWYPTLGKTVFPKWGEVSVCYHEGVPGHHLQLGQVRYLADRLTRFQRVLAMYSSHAEGWALYAERLMDELGYFSKPEYRLGFLRAQVMRAVRVVVDIGMHLELTIPENERYHPGERWTPELGEGFLFERSCFPQDFMASELERYLGWPSQAICYKVGERAWLEGRDRARAAAGPSFNLKAFHSQALALGPLGLDQLVEELGRLALT